MKQSFTPRKQPTPNLTEILNAVVNRLETPPPFSLDDWVAKQEAELADLKRVLAVAAKSHKARVDAFTSVGFTDEQAFVLMLRDTSEIKGKV